jgi:heat shock protein HslJ
MIPSRYLTLLVAASITLSQCKPTKTPKTSTPLLGTTWSLAEVDGEPLITPADARAVHLVLEETGQEQRIHGYAGCNNIAGGYKMSGPSAISFTVAATRMMCSPEKMEIEQFFLDALSNANRYAINGDILELLKDDVILARFKGIVR